MSKFDISVIVACYNPDLQKLKNTIKSINNQKGLNFEIIIADDGSKLDYKQEISAWIEKEKIENCKYNFLEQNVGTVKNILFAIYVSDAKYVKTISPGDYLYDENSLKNYYDALVENDADFVFGRAQYYTLDGKFLTNSNPRNKIAFKKDGIKKSMLSYNDCILGASIAGKTETEKYYLEIIKDKIKYIEDIPLILFSLLDDKKIVPINKRLIWYEFGEGISTNTSRVALLENDYNAIENFMKEKENRLARKWLKFYNAEKKKNPLVRFLKKTLVSPGYPFYRLGNVFGKNNPEINSADKLNAIIR